MANPFYVLYELSAIYIGIGLLMTPFVRGSGRPDRDPWIAAARKARLAIFALGIVCLAAGVTFWIIHMVGA